MKRAGPFCVGVLLWWQWFLVSAYALTAEEVIARVQQQLAVSSEIVIGEMHTYVNDTPYRQYAFVLARQWQPDTTTESVRIDFDSPVALPDADSSMRAQNRYLLKRVGQAPPTQWLYLPALRRVRIAPYDPAGRLLQSDEWFYDLTTITNLSDYQYEFADPSTETPSLIGTPQGKVVPYQKVLLQCQRYGETYVIIDLTAWAAETTRTAHFTDFHEIVPGRFRPQQLRVRTGEASHTDLTFRQWRFDVVGPELFTGTALETRSLTAVVSEPETP
jgi:hypothetical protein